MESNAITIRKAIPADAQAIWHLLRCENKVWDVDHIIKEINSLHILSFGKKLVGVSHSTVTPGCEKIAWVVIHPMYPEGSGYAFLAYGLLGVICRLPKAEVEQRMKSHLKLGHPKQNIGFGIR